MNLEEMSLADLVAAEKIIDKKIDGLLIYRDCQRGKDFVEYERRDALYYASPLHDQLDKVQTRIDEIINTI
jgi:hypothetical protein